MKTITRIVFSLLVALLPGLLVAQSSWRYLGRGEGGAVLALARAPDGALFACMSDRAIYRLDASSGVWRKVPSPEGSSTVRISPSTGTMFTLDRDEQLSRSTDGGASWSSTGTYLFRDAIVSDGSAALFASDGHAVLRSMDDGRSWEGIYPVGDDIVHMMAAGGGSVLALRRGIGDTTAVVASSDAGGHWREVLPRARDGYTFVAATARGSLLVGFGDGRVRRSTDGGTTWSDVAAPTTGIGSLVSTLADGTLLAFDPDGDPAADEMIARSTDDGATWGAISLPGVDDRAWTAVSMPGGDILLGTRTAGARRVNGGWSTSASWNSGLSCVLFRHLVIDRWGRMYGDDLGRLFRSTDGGVDWTPLRGGLDPTAASVQVTPTGAVLAIVATAADSDVHGIVRSTDNGATWSTATWSGTDTPLSFVMREIVSGPGGVLYAMSSRISGPPGLGGLLRSTDDGGSWDRVRWAGDPGISLITALLAEDGGTLLAGTSDYGLIRIDPTTASVVPVASFGPADGLDVAPDRGVRFLLRQGDVILAVTSDARMMRSVDAGATWVTAGRSADLHTPRSLALDSTGVLWLVANHTARSTDAGATWLLSDWGTHNPEALTVDDHGSVYLSCFEGVFTLGASSSVRSAGSESSLRMLEVGPNPAGSRATLELAIDRATSARAALFDLEGRRLRPLFDGYLESGHHRLELDLSGIADGVYLVRLETDGGSATRSIVVAGGAR